MAFAHGDHPPSRSPRCPDHHDDIGIEPSHRLEARLAIIVAVVLVGYLDTGEHLSGTSEV
jgi:hypothetical protein